MLNNYKTNVFEIWILKSKLNDAFPNNTGSFEEYISGKGQVNSKTENAAFKLMENKKKYQNRIDKLINENSTIELFIGTLKSREQELVNKRIKDKKSWSEIAVEMG